MGLPGRFCKEALMKALLRIGQWAIFRTFDGQQSQEETRFASRAVASASRNNSALDVMPGESLQCLA
jgi:hypothetical protein